jgi:hypothetical protein
MSELPPWDVDVPKKAKPRTYDADLTMAEVREFLENIEKDFFIRLSDFGRYAESHFDTDDLSFSDIMSVAEYFTLNENMNVKVSRLLAVIAHRISLCGGSLQDRAMIVIRDMLCFEEYGENNSSVTIRHHNPAPVLDVADEYDDYVDDSSMNINYKPRGSFI